MRSTAKASRARAAAKAAGAKAVELDEKVEVTAGSISISPMHLAKGLEFRAVAVMACDDEVLPLQERVEAVTDEADLLEVYETERHLLYVACTRARDSLWVSGVEPESEFLRDMQVSGSGKSKIIDSSDRLRDAMWTTSAFQSGQPGGP